MQCKLKWAALLANWTAFTASNIHRKIFYICYIQGDCKLVDNSEDL